MVNANKMLCELMKLSPKVLFRSPKSKIITANVTTFSDASFKATYGQTGILTGIYFETNNTSAYHLIDWSSMKQRRVSYSAFGAETIARADADDRGFNLREGLRAVTSNKKIEHHLHVDSRGLYDTITTLHEGKDYRLRTTVQRLRDSFESEQLSVLRWIPGNLNVADALTKRNIQLFEELNRIAATGKINFIIEHGYTPNSKNWK